MREILFRGKKIYGGEWAYGKPWIYDRNEAARVNSHEAIIMNAIEYARKDFGDDLYCEAHPIDPTTIGEFTGLEDAKGSRIFEGDILKICEYPEVWKPESEWDIHYAYVYFDDGSFKLHDYCSSDGYNELSCVYNGFFPSNDSAVFEVIGNIHDNPELLEVI